MAVSATVGANVEVVANNSAPTYITPAFRANNSNIANGSTFRITVAGLTANGFTGSSDYPNQTFPAGSIFNVVMGAAGTVADPVIYSTQELNNGTNQFFKQFYVSVRALGANGQLSIVTSPSLTGNISIARGVSPNVNLTANLFLGVTYQSIAGANQSDYIEVATVEQII